jgi:hypothetical protein
MSKYLSIYTDELNKTAGLGQILTPIAKGLISKGVSGLTNLAKPALTSAAKVEAPAIAAGAGKATSFLPKATQQVAGATNLAAAPAASSAGSRATSFLPKLPQGSTLPNDLHMAKIDTRQAINLARQRGTPMAKQNVKDMFSNYRNLMGQMSQYRTPGI